MMVTFGSSMVAFEMADVLSAIRGGALVFKNNANAEITRITLSSSPGMILVDNSLLITGVPLITSISSITGAAGPAVSITILDTSSDVIIDQIPVADINQDISIALNSSQTAVLYYLRVRGQ